METKKSSKASLEKGKNVALMMGLIVGLAVLFVSFEWGTKELRIDPTERRGPLEPEEGVISIKPDVPPPPPPPPAPVIKEVVAEVLTIVANDVATNDFTLVSSEDNKNEGIPKPVYVPPIVVIDKEVVTDEIFVFVEVKPSFPGGDAEMMAFLGKNVKYPVVALENRISGRVVCSFVVNQDGAIVDIEVLRGIDPSLDKEAVRVIASMPKWEPGRQQNKTVRVRYTLPVWFRIQE